MANYITLTPLASANTNSYGMVFTVAADTVSLEVAQVPEILINKNVTGINLVGVFDFGLVFSKASLNGAIPWSNVVSMKY